MKKIFISLALAITTMAVSAQSVRINTFAGTDVSAYAGELKNVSTSRMMFNGWNTVSLPFSMTEAQLNEAFGTDCRLEKLAGVSQDGDQITLNFVNVKSQGIQANTPYILYYTRPNGVVNLNLQDVRLDNASAELTFTTSQGATVTMGGAKTMRDGAGLYGIRAIDNKEASFVDVTGVSTRFLATRCYVEVSGALGAKLISTHNDSATGIQSVATAQENSNAAYDLAGRRVNKTVKGIKIVNGKKQF